MSITLFHCPKCDVYSTSATVNLVVSATLSPKRYRLWPHDISYPQDGVPLKDIAESRCNECDGLTNLVTLDECPHLWQSLHSDPSNRVCAYCGVMQQGRVVFDE